MRDRDTQRHTERKRARDLTLRDSCTDNSMQFGTRTATTEPSFMGTWQNADTNLLFRMSQQVCLLYFNATCWSVCLLRALSPPPPFYFLLSAFHFCLNLTLHSFWSVITKSLECSCLLCCIPEGGFFLKKRERKEQKYKTWYGFIIKVPLKYLKYIYCLCCFCFLFLGGLSPPPLS